MGVEENFRHCGRLSLLPLTKLEDNGTVVKEKERTGSETVSCNHVTIFQTPIVLLAIVMSAARGELVCRRPDSAPHCRW